MGHCEGGTSWRCKQDRSTQTQVKAEIEAWFHSQATVSSYTKTTWVKVQKHIIQPFNASKITASENVCVFVKIYIEINCVEPDHTLQSDLDPHCLSMKLQNHIRRLQKQTTLVVLAPKGLINVSVCLYTNCMHVGSNSVFIVCQN